MRNLLFVILVILTAGCNQRPEYDTIIRNGLLYDGLGGEPYKADIGIIADTIAFIGDLSGKKGTKDIDVNGKAVAPGFINMLSWATESLIEDGSS